MLIECPECNNQISDKAASCPQCGNPITPNNGQYVTTQQTGKSIKLQQLLAGIVIIIGTFGIFGAQTDQGRSISILIISGGIIWYIIARFLNWWHYQ